ncbi:MAG TPA: chemotaxis protein CheW [Thermodesulfobacteriota bacterium]|nr:chemotaxis protein CheW [Thermodesulfobacteriota bacterium]
MPPSRVSIEREMQKENQEKKKDRQILVFSVANEEMGLDISCVREVLRPQAIYPLPKTPPFIDGVINLRGHIVALIDLRKRLDARQIEDENNKRIIVCKLNKSIVGLTVSSLKEIITLSEEHIRPTPEVVSMQMETDVVSGIATVGNRMIAILDLEHILTKKEAVELSALER